MADGTTAELTDPAAVANYVATMSAELSMLAHQHGFEALGFLLEMAHLRPKRRPQIGWVPPGKGGRLD